MFEKTSRMSLFKKKYYGEIGDNKIKLVDEFEVTIPNYKFDDVLSKRCGQKWFRGNYIHDLLKDGTFKDVSYELVPEEKYVVKIFRIGKWSPEYSNPFREGSVSESGAIKIEDCLSFLKKQKAYMVGLQGLMLLGDCVDQKIMKDKPIISLDLPGKLTWGAFDRIPVLGIEGGERYIDFGEPPFLFDPGINLLCINDFEPHFA